MYARKPLPFQKVTITAQNRKDPNQNTGISIHACRLLAQPDLEASKASFPTYLGRPWKLYSRTVYMQTYMGDHIHPRGWLEWNATFALDTLYYGEYMNYGPGGAVGQRVNWPGYRVITTIAEASRYTVAQFIYGSSWLPSTGVAFIAGLSVAPHRRQPPPATTSAAGKLFRRDFSGETKKTPSHRIYLIHHITLSHSPNTIPTATTTTDASPPPFHTTPPNTTPTISTTTPHRDHATPPPPLVSPAATATASTRQPPPQPKKGVCLADICTK
nr:probable pectinesterase/pectinesterase inhibitor 34 [Tanacetum cinerariifolium]